MYLLKVNNPKYHIKFYVFFILEHLMFYIFMLDSILCKLVHVRTPHPGQVL